jgi:hypothetical protein
MTFQPTYILFSDELAEMLDLPFNDYDHPLTEHDINAGIMKYALANKGITGQQLNHDRVLWQAMDVNQSMIITTETIWNYLLKYLEEI